MFNPAGWKKLLIWVLAPSTVRWKIIDKSTRVIDICKWSTNYRVVPTTGFKWQPKTPITVKGTSPISILKVMPTLSSSLLFSLWLTLFLFKEATLADDLAVYNTYSKVTTMFLLYLWRKKSKKRLVDRSRALFSASVSSALFPCVYFLSSSGSYGRNSLTGCVCNCTIQPAELTCTHHRFAGSFLGPILDISTNSSIRLKWQGK